LLFVLLTCTILDLDLIYLFVFAVPMMIIQIGYCKWPVMYKTAERMIWFPSGYWGWCYVGRLIFRHRKSQEYINGVPLEPNFTLPRYALPPSTRATAVIPLHCPNTTRNAMINWALLHMVERVQKERRKDGILLLKMAGGLDELPERL
jgi:hypothetical protein